MTSKESSITVAVRVRPFTESESAHLIKHNDDQMFLGDGSLNSTSSMSSSAQHYQQQSQLQQSQQQQKFSGSKFSPRGIRKIINVVDDRMLIFDPPENNPLNKMARNAFPGKNRIREHRFVFDRLFDANADQEYVYNATTKPLLDSVLDGYNATVFAYGATGCGKTHTITGTPDDPGIIFLTMKELFKRIDELSDTQIVDVSMSFLEIYNESIKDLLNPSLNFKNLNLREDANNKISVTNLSSHKPKSVEEVMELILVGNQNRTISSTEANATSSRSHAVLQVNIIQKSRTADINEEHTFATLSIIDLAGSERAAATRNRGERLQEGANINKSLLALGNCINALCDPRRRNHVPYRDSKLTRLLKFSLGGNCKTVMIVCISPSSQHYDETLNTLKYANRAKEIKTKVIRNQHNLDRHVGSYLKMITEQKQEIQELRARESKIVINTTSRQKLIHEKCLNSLMENLKNLQTTLNKQNQDVFNKILLLTKRKIFLLLKNQLQDFSNSFDHLFSNELLPYIENHLQGFSNMKANADQVISRFHQQINEIEINYSKEGEIDKILSFSSKGMLKNLQEMEGWSNANNVMFESHLYLLKDHIYREIFYQSSILFDQLIEKLNLGQFQWLALLNSIHSLIDYHLSRGNSSNIPKNLADIVQSIEDHLNSLGSGEFDLKIDKSCNQFFQNLMTVSKLENGDDNSTFSYQKNERSSVSPLNTSPANNFRKTLKKKPSGTISPSAKSRLNKKVRWSVPNADSDTDTSMDDNSTLQAGNDEKDKVSIEHDDLGIIFDPSLDSPQQKSTSMFPMIRSPAADYKKKKSLPSRSLKSTLTGRKLLGSNIPSSLNISGANIRTFSNSSGTTANHIIPINSKPESKLNPNTSNFTFNDGNQLGLPTSPKMKLKSLGAPTRLMTSTIPDNQYGPSSFPSDINMISSSGSENV